MKVCIAEKPTVAREIALVIGANKKMNGYYEGNGYQVTWSYGHLCTLKEPHDYSDRWKYWDLSALPMLPQKYGIKLINDPGIKKQFEVIQNLLKKAEEVINCGDAGQEGELIQRWVLSKAKYTGSLKRLWISSLTEEAIKEGFRDLREGSEFNNLYAAGSARAIGDWLLGMNATRLYTLKYGRNKQVLSIGRVQTPTLSMIVKRQLEIDSFKPEPYWELKTVYRESVFALTSGRFVTREEADSKLNEITDHEFFILSSETKPGSEAPPRLFDLTSLQVECNKKFSFTAETTLKIIQSLYEKKLTTYPRVDTTYLSEDLFKKVPEIFSGLTPYKDLTAPLLNQNIKKSSRIFDDKKITDHHAIIPTGQLPATLTADEKSVFDLVTRRFICVFYPDCKIAHTTVMGESNHIEFKAVGKQILEQGWRAVYQEDSGKKSDEETILPNFSPGEHGKHIPQVTEKMTQPPKHYTEATLLRAMETAGKKIDDEELRDLLKENGIGRPSTRANIIETLFRRKYIYRDKKKIIATQTGIDLIEIIENDLLKSAELTGQWERKLRLIEGGKLPISVFMSDLKQMVTDVVLQVKNSSGKVVAITEKNIPADPAATQPNNSTDREEKEVIRCPRCNNGKIIKGNQSWGCSAYKSGCDFRLPFEFLGKKLGKTAIKALCTNLKTAKMNGFKMDDRVVAGAIIMRNDNQLSFEEEKPTSLYCPRCKKGTILKGKSSWGCSDFRNGCHLRVPFCFMGKPISETQLNQLILSGKTSKITGLTRIDGIKTSGILVFNSEWEISFEV